MLKDRLIELIDLEGLNPNQFYVKTGLGNGFLNNVGETLRRPSLDKIKKAFPHWNTEYILKGEGKKTITIKNNSGTVNTGTIGGDNINNSRGVYNKGSISGDVLTGDNNTPISDKDQRILLLENEVKHLNELLAEKERFIQALLKK